MGIDEILAEIPKLSAEDRSLLRKRLDELDPFFGYRSAADDLTPEDNTAIDEALANYKKNPTPEAREELAARLRKQLSAKRQREHDPS